MSNRKDIGKIIGQKLAQARAGLNLSLRDVAKEMGYPNYQTLSSIEKGDRNLKAWELAKLAHLYHRTVDYFINLDSKDVINPKLILWRQQPTGKEEKIAQQQFVSFCNNYRRLEELTDAQRPAFEPPRIKKEDFFNAPLDNAKELAVKRHRALNLGARPAKVLEEILTEEEGIKVAYLDFTIKCSSAAAYDPEGFGAVIVINNNEAPWRRKYDLAHEYFHLLTWNLFKPEQIQGKPGEKSLAEKCADAFASVLLLPRESLSADLSKIAKGKRLTCDNVVDLARQYGVSLDAMIWGLFNNNLIDDKMLSCLHSDGKIKDIDKKKRSNDWHKDISRDYLLLAYKAYINGNLSKGRFAELIGKNIAEVDRYLIDLGLDPNEGCKYEATAS